MTSCMAGPEPLYGTWTIFTPASDWKDSPSMWLMLPIPELANVYLPGFSLRILMNSVRFFAGNEALTVRMLGIDAILVIGAKLSSVYCGRERVAAWTIIELTVATVSV